MNYYHNLINKMQLKKGKNTLVKKIMLLVIVALVTNELICSYKRYTEGAYLYNKALQVSKDTNKRLVVIGNPTASWKNKIFGSSYGCGDLCIDLAGCKCPNLDVRTKKLEALSTLQKIPTDSVIVFESGTKHLVPGLEMEMKRVGGENVYSVNINDTSVILFLSHYTGAVLT